MKHLLNIAVYVLALYGGYVLIAPHLPPPFNQEQKSQPMVSTNIAPRAAESVATTQPMPRAPAVPAASTPKRIACPTCQGEGRLTYVDGRGRNHSYGCPICGFSGENRINPPAGAYTCPDCRGMGRTELRQTRNDVVGYIVDASRCQRCNGTGWIRPASEPGSKNATPHVKSPTPVR